MERHALTHFVYFNCRQTPARITGEHQPCDGESSGLCPFQMMAAQSTPTVLFAECFRH